ncbi:hypothetical protein [Rhodovulum sp. 12E13]|uniref:hypothetical protein n=1 Tax=Rhodovulum sp. 12E13 TaxID=2203891 RepID=UPI0018F7B45E|nr:hypothetical protein [Rhodovulum sp. 12E13]
MATVRSLFASSFAYNVFRLAVPTATWPPMVELFRPLPVTVRDPVSGAGAVHQDAPTNLAVALVAALAWTLYGTLLGLVIRMTGACLTLAALNSFFPTMAQGRRWT